MTHLHDIVDPADLGRALAEGLVNIRVADDGQRIFNYSDAALYTPGAWDNPAVRACRGLIVDQNDRVVARPWAKFFNHGQAEAGTLDLDAPVEVTDKMDGSLGIIHLDQAGRIRVATRGSFESEQAIHATEWLRRRSFGMTNLNRITPLVEIIYPGNRIVCDYGDRDELVLLGGVVIDGGEYIGPEETTAWTGWPGRMTRRFEYDTLRDALAAPPRPGAEGLCVRFVEESRIVKIKQADYVALHKIVTGLSERSVWEHMVEGNNLAALLGELPDELHAWTRDVWHGLRAEQLAIELKVRLTHSLILDHLAGAEWERRDYAALAMKQPDIRPWLFNLLDGKDPAPSILRTLKPAGDTRAKPISEAVA